MKTIVKANPGIKVIYQDIDSGVLYADKEVIAWLIIVDNDSFDPDVSAITAAGFLTKDKEFWGFLFPDGHVEKPAEAWYPSLQEANDVERKYFDEKKEFRDAAAV